MIEKEQCDGCGVCVDICPYKVLSIEEETAYVKGTCTLCAVCVRQCPQEAISMPGGSIKGEEEVSNYKGLWIFAELKKNKPIPVVYELIGKGRELADQLEEELSLVVAGHDVKEAVEDFSQYPVDRIIACEDPLLEEYHDERYTHMLTRYVQKYRPAVLLLGATTNGRSLAPRTAARLGTGLTADCTELEIDFDRKCLLQTRPAYGGNILATITCQYQRPQMATVRPKVFPKAEPSDQMEPAVEYDQVDMACLPVKVVLKEKKEEVSDLVSIEEADIVVAGGRGLGSEENFGLIEELASLMGGAVGASRAVVDEGWTPYNRQVGQTGRTISPKVYIACGISGAIQHQIGMRSAETIIAINKNEDAPIFQIADYGIVGDVNEVLRLLISQMKE